MEDLKSSANAKPLPCNAFRQYRDTQGKIKITLESKSLIEISLHEIGIS